MESSINMEQMFEQAAAVVIFGVPERTEFGIDLESWNVGHKFKGIKLIPPGLHYIYFSSVSKYGDTAPRTGFFHWFDQKEVLVKNYDVLEEDLFDEKDTEKIERIKLNLKDLDGNLGPYPLKSWTKWISFTQHIDKDNLRRLQPSTGKISSVPELINVDSLKASETSPEVEDKSDESQGGPSVVKKARMEEGKKEEEKEGESNSSSVCNVRKVTRDSRGLPCMVAVPGTSIKFSEFPERPHKDGATPSEVSWGNIDSTYTVDFLLKQLNRPESILAEIQFSFVCFLVGQVYEGFEHWRKLMTALCKAERTLINHPSLYSDFLSILHHQIREVPPDLFADIVENSNFLVAALRTLFANISDNSRQLPDGVVSKAKKFKAHLSSKFRWSLSLEEDEEDLPVVVET